MLNLSEDKDYHENRAKLILCRVLEFDQERLIRKDKPDLQYGTDKIGIEVVFDCYENEQANTSFIDKYYKVPIVEIPINKIRHYQSRGGTYDVENGLFIPKRLGHSMPNAPIHLIETIKKKVHLINKGQYKPFASYHLYVRVDTVSPLYPSYIYGVISEIKEYTTSRDYHIKHDTIYLDGWYEIIVCDMNNEAYKTYSITRELQNWIHKELRNSHTD